MPGFEPERFGIGPKIAIRFYFYCYDTVSHRLLMRITIVAVDSSHFDYFDDLVVYSYAVKHF